MTVSLGVVTVLQKSATAWRGWCLSARIGRGDIKWLFADLR
jgi:hypothetical protein